MIEDFVSQSQRHQQREKLANQTPSLSHEDVHEVHHGKHTSVVYITTRYFQIEQLIRKRKTINICSCNWDSDLDDLPGLVRTQYHSHIERFSVR